MSEIAFEMAGCEIASSAAAFAMLPRCTTASRMCRSRSLRRRPFRSAHCIVGPYSKGYVTFI